MKIKQKNRCIEVIEIALRHWDPIGVIDMNDDDDICDDEYDSYAPAILTMLENGKNAKGISNHLAQLRHVSMCLGIKHPSEHEDELGEKLINWRDSGYKNVPDFRFTRYSFNDNDIV